MHILKVNIYISMLSYVLLFFFLIEGEFLPYRSRDWEPQELRQKRRNKEMRTYLLCLSGGEGESDEPGSRTTTTPSPAPFLCCETVILGTRILWL